MKRIILTLTLTLSLAIAGCATMPDGTKVFLPTASVANPLGPTSLYDIKATYAIAATAAATYNDRYRAGNRCTKTQPESLTNLCSRRSVVLRLQRADSVATSALAKATAFVTNNPTLDASDAIAAAREAVNIFYNIKKGGA